MTPRSAPSKVAAAQIETRLQAEAEKLDPAPIGEVRDAGTAWASGGREFAVTDSAGVSFRLGAEIGAAALRTPDVAGSTLGPDWITFSPAELDGHALDRLVAWFAAAHRRAR